MNLNESDFRISGISENSLIKLRTGNKTITITALGNDNVVTGMAIFNLIVNPVSISIRSYKLFWGLKLIS
ncbi:hypothetical protein [Spiroplasma endosymbiont of Phyllotreta cruciferae]|uniref:hypothetical protein n=1 Tax=Spiroplasma endosymbiont of Phyllotreta cruciferae TaxID=2886375 RepID=UPI0020A0F927|nr:hypothetical protein [Spiroplasma endosymbiont of Phyllotreta cruciferae]